MSVITAQILIGKTHPNHNGIDPTHVIYLSENSRPTLILLKEDLFVPTAKKGKYIWIPSIENIVDDIMLMIGLLVLEDKKLKQNINDAITEKNFNQIELLKDIGSDALKKIYVINKEVINNYKDIRVAFSVFKESTLEHKLSDLTDYNIDIEVCTTKFLKFYSNWSKKIIIEGSL